MTQINPQDLVKLCTGFINFDYYFLLQTKNKQKRKYLERVNFKKFRKFRKSKLTTILLLFAIVAFGQWQPIEAGKGVIITEKDGVLSISMDTTKPCDRCPKFSLDTFVPTIDTIYEVSWDLVEKHPLPCPVVETTDSFGRKTWQTQAVYRYTKTYVPQRKEFWNKEDAIRFVELAKREIDLANVRLETFLKIRPFSIQKD